jgi:hypothetical protein
MWSDIFGSMFALHFCFFIVNDHTYGIREQCLQTISIFYWIAIYDFMGWCLLLLQFCFLNVIPNDDNSITEMAHDLDPCIHPSISLVHTASCSAAAAVVLQYHSRASSWAIVECCNYEIWGHEILFTRSSHAYKAILLDKFFTYAYQLHIDLDFWVLTSNHAYGLI